MLSKIICIFLLYYFNGSYDYMLSREIKYITKPFEQNLKLWDRFLLQNRSADNYTKVTRNLLVTCDIMG